MGTTVGLVLATFTAETKGDAQVQARWTQGRLWRPCQSDVLHIRLALPLLLSHLTSSLLLISHPKRRKGTGNHGGPLN